MSFPAAVAICEDDLRRDLTFLKAFAGERCDLRVSPLGGGALRPGARRLVAEQVRSFRAAGIEVRAIVVHHDRDRSGLQAARASVEKWFAGKDLADLGCKLVRCVPAPCIEAWLCRVEGRKPKSANPAAGCEPWKEAWEAGSGIDLDRVRAAAEAARGRLPGLPDFDAFHSEWLAAGLP